MVKAIFSLRWLYLGGEGVQMNNFLILHPTGLLYTSGKNLRVKLTPSNLYLYSKTEVWGGQVKNQ